MILAIWSKGSFKVLEKKDISEDYNRYQYDAYQQNVLKIELRKIGYDWECMEYGLFETEEELANNMKHLIDEKIKFLEEIQNRVKQINHSK